MVRCAMYFVCIMRVWELLRTGVSMHNRSAFTVVR
jgi:hypothetical protein